PTQVKILPISEKFEPYTLEVLAALKAKDIRAEADLRNEKIGKKIRDAELDKAPYMLVIGEKEMNDKTVAVRKHGQGDQGVQSLDALIEEINAVQELVYAR